MTARSYLKLESWHVLASVNDAGWRTRCGRVITTEKTQASDHLPLGERSCESCLRLIARDDDSAETTNDEVPE